jgi:DNA uptake protein ComE-like DNA-binding protein
MLVNHPYIDYYLAKSIVNHRDKKGKYSSLAEMKKTLLIYDELYLKITPYLTVE